MIKALGYDPGGKKNNGVAWVRIGEDGTFFEEHKDIVSSSNEALDWLNIHSEGASIVGIDTMLAWSFQQRPCDGWIRRKYGLKGFHVQSLGSLQGAMLANGLLVARELQLCGFDLAEAHPKALRIALGEHKPTVDDHGDDARLGALAAAKWKANMWSLNLYGLPNSNFWFPAGPAVYPWPGE